MIGFSQYRFDIGNIESKNRADRICNSSDSNHRVRHERAHRVRQYRDDNQKAAAENRSKRRRDHTEWASRSGSLLVG